MNSPSNQSMVDINESSESPVSKPPTGSSNMLQELRSDSHSREESYSVDCLKQFEHIDDHDSNQSSLNNETPFFNPKNNQDIIEQCNGKQVINNSLNQQQLSYQDQAWMNIFNRLPMFQERVLYPEFHKNLVQYKNEAQTLFNYMYDVYKTKPYDVDQCGLLRFPVKERWLRGEEYGFLLRHYKTYQALAKLQVHYKKQDPLVYDQPKNGQLYYIKGFHLREFGFPRLRDFNNTQQRKDFKWKKTNFVTDLPKHSPIARYLVAKSKNRDENFFMHCSVLYQEYNTDYKNPTALRKLKEKKQKLMDEDVEPSQEFERIILCHILEKDDLACHEEDEEEYEEEEDLEDEEEPFHAQTFSSASANEDQKQQEQSIGQINIQSIGQAENKQHQQKDSQSSNKAEQNGLRRSTRIKEVLYSKPKTQYQFDLFEHQLAEKMLKKREAKALNKLQSNKNNTIAIDKNNLLKDQKEQKEQHKQHQQQQQQQQQLQQQPPYQISFYQQISQPKSKWTQPRKYSPVRSLRREQESEQLIEQDQYSQLNDSDSTDEELIQLLSARQIVNIVKSYQQKLRKWSHINQKFAVKLRWFQKMKINYYQMKIKTWNSRLPANEQEALQFPPQQQLQQQHQQQYQQAKSQYKPPSQRQYTSLTPTSYPTFNSNQNDNYSDNEQAMYQKTKFSQTTYKPPAQVPYIAPPAYYQQLYQGNVNPFQQQMNTQQDLIQQAKPQQQFQKQSSGSVDQGTLSKKKADYQLRREYQEPFQQKQQNQKPPQSMHSKSKPCTPAFKGGVLGGEKRKDDFFIGLETTDPCTNSEQKVSKMVPEGNNDSLQILKEVKPHKDRKGIFQVTKIQKPENLIKCEEELDLKVELQKSSENGFFGKFRQNR